MFRVKKPASWKTSWRNKKRGEIIKEKEKKEKHRTVFKRNVDWDRDLYNITFNRLEYWTGIENYLQYYFNRLSLCLIVKEKSYAPNPKGLPDELRQWSLCICAFVPLSYISFLGSLFHVRLCSQKRRLGCHYLHTILPNCTKENSRE